MANPKQEETFKVIDRRLFTEDGALRKEVVEEEERREEEAAARAATQAANNKTAHAEATKSAKDSNPSRSCFSRHARARSCARRICRASGGLSQFSDARRFSQYATRLQCWAAWPIRARDKRISTSRVRAK